MPAKKRPKFLKVNKFIKTEDNDLVTQESWLVDSIVDGPKIDIVNGKPVTLYKVRWWFVFLFCNNKNKLIKVAIKFLINKK